jgi:hypothetical protein
MERVTAERLVYFQEQIEKLYHNNQITESDYMLLDNAFDTVFTNNGLFLEQDTDY